MDALRRVTLRQDDVREVSPGSLFDGNPMSYLDLACFRCLSLPLSLTSSFLLTFGNMVVEAVPTVRQLSFDILLLWIIS